jgi:hypothetical protein
MMFDMDGDMKKNMQSWFEREFALDGVLAAGGGVSPTSVFAAFAAGEFVLASNEEVWRNIGEMVQAVSAHGAPTGEMIWGFERAVLCTIQRLDGAWLGVITDPQLRDDSALALRAKLDAFKQQTFVS